MTRRKATRADRALQAMPHRYVIFSARFEPFTGGVESYTSNVARQLVAEGDEVAVVTTLMDGSPEREVRADGVQIWRLPGIPLVGGRFPFPRPGATRRALLDALVRQGADRVLVNNRFYPHSITGLRFARRVGAPAILLDHGSMHLTIGTPALDWVIRRYEHVLTRMTKRFAPCYAGVSAKSAEWLGHFGISCNLVLPNAIDACAFRTGATGRDFRKELGIAKGCMLVAYVGRLAPEKGPDVLVGAARAFDAAEVAFALAGEGTLRGRLEADLPPNVHLLGNLEHGDLAALLMSADAFCLPTRSEGFCTSLLEAAACGLPSVIPDVGGAREVLGGGEGGIIVENATVEAIEGALRSLQDAGGEGRRAMGDAARRRVDQDHGWPATALALRRAFDDMR